MPHLSCCQHSIAWLRNCSTVQNHPFMHTYACNCNTPSSALGPHTISCTTHPAGHQAAPPADVSTAPGMPILLNLPANMIDSHPYNHICIQSLPPQLALLRTEAHCPICTTKAHHLRPRHGADPLIWPCTSCQTARESCTVARKNDAPRAQSLQTRTHIPAVSTARSAGRYHPLPTMP